MTLKNYCNVVPDDVGWYCSHCNRWSEDKIESCVAVVKTLHQVDKTVDPFPGGLVHQLRNLRAKQNDIHVENDTYDYLATPYSDPDSSIRYLRFIAAELHTAHLLTRGIIVYSPIVYGHHLASAHNLPQTQEFWKAHNFAMLGGAHQLRILMIPGWGMSTGIDAEHAYAVKLGLEIIYDGTETLRELVGSVYGLDDAQ